VQVIVERYLAPLLIVGQVAQIAGIQQAMNDMVDSAPPTPVMAR
jgi:hypothetical protein